MTLQQYAQQRCPAEFVRWKTLIDRGVPEDSVEIARLHKVMEDAIKADAIAGKINLSGVPGAAQRA